MAVEAVVVAAAVVVTAEEISAEEFLVLPDSLRSTVLFFLFQGCLGQGLLVVCFDWF